jgi:hypothetical protein
MAVATQQGFVEATILDPSTGTLSAYHPLIINQGSTAAVAPVIPKLPAGAVVGLWFGFNGGVLVLQDAQGKVVTQSTLLDGANCIQGNQGVLNDVFGQVSWCNAQQFFAAANAAIKAGKTKIPPLGTTSNGAACPSTRSFQIVDACPNDNVVTAYLVNPTTGATAQDTAANRANLMAQGFVLINNASDEGLVADIIDPALGCKPFTIQSLDNSGTFTGTLASGELSAAAGQAAPISLIPLNDPDTLITVNGANTGGTSVTKTNTYRLGVNQNVINNADSGALIPYCTNLQNVQPPFLLTNQAKFSGITSPAANIGSNLFTFMCSRFLTSLTQLGCPAPAGGQTVTITTDGNGVATACTIVLNAHTTATTTTVAAKVTTTVAATTTTKMATTTTTAASTAVNLQTFTGALGGISAGAVTASGAQFTSGGNQFNTLAAALQRSCSVQNNACANAANAQGQKTTFTVAQCNSQNTACNAAGPGTGPTTTVAAAATTSTSVAVANASAGAPNAPASTTLPTQAPATTTTKAAAHQGSF